MQWICRFKYDKSFSFILFILSNLILQYEDLLGIKCDGIPYTYKNNISD